MTGSMAQRKSKLPEANKMARMLRSGRTTGDLAVRYGINSLVIVQQLTANGWDAGTGAWVGGDKKDYQSGAPLTARGDGAGLTCHHVGGGDNPTVVSTATRPFRERPRPAGFPWPPAPVAVPPEPKLTPRAQANLWKQVQQAGNNARRKLNAEQEVELAKRYLIGLESAVVLARDFGVNERTVRKRLHALGIPLRTRSEALQLRHQQQRAAVDIELPTVVSPMKGGGSDGLHHLGLVVDEPLAGGEGSSGPPCDFCGEIDGHTGQCPVISRATVTTDVA